jgi:DNA-binding LytR/AlgR family response regulator
METAPPIGQVVWHSLRDAPEPTKRQLRIILLTWAATLILQYLDSRGRHGPRVWAEIASVLLFTGGTLLLGMMHVLRGACAETVEDVQVKREGRREIRVLVFRRTLGPILFALPTMGVMAGAALAAGATVLMVRFFLGSSPIVIVLAGANVAVLIAAWCMHALIVDDESAARRRLAAMLEELDVEIVGEAADGISALDLIRERRPDVVLLDIAMPEVDGFDVARHAPEPKPLIIFQTAFGDHALKAFEHDALDYVVKPVTRARLEQAIERARRRLEGAAHPVVTLELLERVESALGQSRLTRRSRVLVRHGTGHRAILLRDVAQFVADEGLVVAVTSTARFLTDYSLNELESRLSDTFVRASRAALVNLDRIDRVVGNADGSATLTLVDGPTVHVSRRRTAAVRQALE